MRDPDVSDDSVANNSKGKSEEHDYATEFEAIGDDGDHHCDYGCNGVGDDGPELGLVCCITKFDNDSWKL